MKRDDTPITLAEAREASVLKWEMYAEGATISDVRAVVESRHGQLEFECGYCQYARDQVNNGVPIFAPSYPTGIIRDSRQIDCQNCPLFRVLALSKKECMDRVLHAECPTAREFKLPCSCCNCGSSPYIKYKISKNQNERKKLASAVLYWIRRAVTKKGELP